MIAWRSRFQELTRAAAGAPLLNDPAQRSRILTTPVQVDVTGFVFPNSSRLKADDCTKNGGQGIRAKDGVSRVKGLCELKPAIKVVRVTP